MNLLAHNPSTQKRFEGLKKIIDNKFNWLRARVVTGPARPARTGAGQDRFNQLDRPVSTGFRKLSIFVNFLLVRY